MNTKRQGHGTGLPSMKKLPLARIIQFLIDWSK